MSILITFTLYRRCVHSTLSTSSRRTCRARFSRRISPWCPGGLMTPMKRTVMKISWNRWWTRPAVHGWWWNMLQHNTRRVFWGFPYLPQRDGEWCCDECVPRWAIIKDVQTQLLLWCFHLFTWYEIYIYSIYATFHLAKFCLPDVASCFHFHHFPFQGVSSG